MTRSSSTPSLLDALTDTPRLSAHAWRRLGWLRRYLIATRAAALPLTLFSCLFGGLLALPWTPSEGWRLGLATVALVLAHAAANLLSDQLGSALGFERDGNFRARHGSHPLAQGLINPFTHVLFLVITAAAAVLPVLLICRIAGPAAYWLAGAGVLLLMVYAWPWKPPGASELIVFLVWGPMMAGGVYWLVSGDWGPEILVLSAVFGLGPMVAVLGRQADQRRDDAARGIRTLSVTLGPVRGPRIVALLAMIQLAGALIWVWVTGSWSYLLVLLGLPSLVSLVRVCLRRRPTARPKGYPANVWPVWYGASTFRFARVMGAALAAGALVDGL